MPKCTPEITISGSGPSSKGYGKTTVTTKKFPTDADYVALRHLYYWNQWTKERKDKPILLFDRRCNCKHCRECRDIPIDFSADKTYWDEYYASFNPKNRKASLGTVAVFLAVERWKPKTIGLIGFDGILDSTEETRLSAVSPHDAFAEKQAILSLTNIVDLRNDSYIRGL